MGRGHNAPVLRHLARFTIGGLAALLAVSELAAAQKGKPSKGPFVELVATARVEAPRPVVRRNGHKLLEVDVTILSYVLSPDQPAGADRGVIVDMSGRVRVVHDLSCGDKGLVLAAGDVVELKGEYVPKKGGGDRIEFTHSASNGASAGCSRRGERPDGYLRKRVAATPTPKPVGPRPADLIPEQPFVGTPRPSEKGYEEILRLKESGSDDAELLAKIRKENVRYSLTTPEIQKLRAAGVSPAVIEAMLSSGRAPTPR